MDLGAITAKLQDKTEDLKDQNARNSALREEQGYDSQARFEDAIQEALCDLKRFVDSDEYPRVLEFLCALEEHKQENGGESIPQMRIKAINAKLEKLQEERSKLVSKGESGKVQAFNKKHIFPLHEEIRRLTNIDLGLILYLEDDGCELTCEGFKRRSNNATRGPLSLEEIVRNFSKSDDLERHPSKLLPLIEAELKKRMALVT